jgi:hypothetical protein
MSESMAVIRKFPNEIEAILARTVLEANNIDADVLRDDAGGMLPALHVMFPVRLVVRAVDAERAIAILDSTVDEVQDEDSDESTRDVS